MAKDDSVAKSGNQQLPVENKVESLIRVIRGQQVMLDRDLAELYGVETRRLNEQVKRNIERFPEDFMFQLTKEEFENWKSQFATSNSIVMGARKRPYAFTEQGVAMLSGVLKSSTAVEANIRIMRAFVSMRHFMVNNAAIFQRLETIEFNQLESNKVQAKILAHQEVQDHRIDEIFRRLDEGMYKPKQGIFFDNQIYDAYSFVSELVKSAKQRIILIDNYVDETVLTLLDKRGENVSATIYTQQVSRQFRLDVDCHNSQYPPIEVDVFRRSHDRFLCIDDTVYHVGASIKDLGKKWFAFSKMEDFKPEELVARINEAF
ncbi:ORF6N domain-containing protein [Segatella copri]|uniref:ORF6N domain-containing protein n=1 Tax=Segatella copri TaxID=165179 RepID=UPI003F70E413